jgi:hypothetical protein
MRLMAFASALALISCADTVEPRDDDAASSSRGETVATTAGAGGRAPDGSGAGDGDGGGGGATTTAGDGGGSSAAEGGAGTGAGGEGPAPPECEPLQSALLGTVDGQDLSGTFGVLGQGYGFGARFTFPTLGGVFLRGVDEAYPTSPVAVEGLVRMPQEGPDPGAWYACGAGSELVTDGTWYVEATLEGVGRLGACPGATVEGFIDVCYGDVECGGGTTARGAIDGAEVDWELTSAQGYGELGSTSTVVESVILADQGGLITLEATEIDPEATGIETSALGEAFFVIPEGQPDAGAVYCAGAGSTLTYEGGPIPIPLSARLTRLSRVGRAQDAPSTDDTLGFCMNQSEGR